jgi:hypothetical protein
MSGEQTEVGSVTIDESAVDPLELPITGRIVLAAMAGGLAGTVLMLPLLVGVPNLLNLFSTAPITDFAGFGAFLGLEPTVQLGIALFLVGGTIVLPLMFVVVGAFLPPRSPRYVRGATFATLFWTGFLPAFWPPGDALTVSLFVVVSLASHWVYGLALGYVLDRTSGIPQHRV